ncbi:hypothetical protein PC114_g4900 [Phytophthora cactorum]|uniref:C2H2-type domain-containing protein n=1 Tax=Phytophthora cactorum TaxID=29920 RepID=A0A8T1DKZ2_9STRA|nr:hypothetical protein PC114_g4900 [Phytophthora cactorum]KAG2939672.1 hypothetical protein PC115_g2969 [Phytophthora cactorum]
MNVVARRARSLSLGITKQQLLFQATTNMQDIQLDRIVIPADTTLKQNNSGSRAFQCPDVRCGRRFNRKYTLTEHMKTHTGERPHVCRARGCGKRFSTSGNLSRHMRLHGAIEPVHCPVKGCTSKFMSDIKLTKHMRSHYVPRTHTCKVPRCGKSFSTTGNLNRHLKNQHTEQEREKYKTPAPSSPTLSFICSTPTNQKCSTPTRESPTGIDQEWAGNAWELASESIEMELPAPFETACTTPWTPEMLDILSKMLLD